MPNPYIDSLKIAKELENKAKEFQKKKKEIEDGLESIDSILEILKKFGLREDVNESVKKVRELLKDRNLDDAEKIYAQLFESLKRSWSDYYSKNIKDRISTIIKELGDNYSYLTRTILLENYENLDVKGLEELAKSIFTLDKAIRDKLGERAGEANGNILDSLERDSYLLIRQRDEINSKLKEILSRISQLELYAYKNKLNIVQIEKDKKEAISLFKQDNFEKTMELLDEYEKKLNNSIIENINTRLSEIGSLFDKGKKLEVNLDEFRESYENIKNGEIKYEINQLSESIKRLQQLIERKIFDDTISKLSRLNNELKELYGDSVPEKMSGLLRRVREAIKQNDMDSAFQMIKEANREMEEIKKSQNDLLAQVINIKSTINSLPIPNDEKEELNKELNFTMSLKIIDKTNVENLTKKLEKSISDLVIKYWNDIDDAIMLIEKYNKSVNPLLGLDVSKRDLETLLILVDAMPAIINQLKEIGDNLELRLKENGVELKCSGGENVSELVKSINACRSEYQKILFSQFDQDIKIISIYNKFLAENGFNITKAQKIIQILEKHPEKKADEIRKNAEDAILKFREIVNTVIRNWNIGKDAGNIENLDDAGRVGNATEYLREFKLKVKEFRERLIREMNGLALSELNLIDQEDSDSSSIISNERIVRIKINNSYGRLSNLNWYKKYSKSQHSINTYQELKNSVLGSVTLLLNEFPDLVLDIEKMKDIICLRDIDIGNKNNDKMKFEEIAKSRIIKDLSTFYNIDHASSEEEIDNIVREKTKEIIKEIRGRRPTSTVNFALGKVENILRERPRQAYISVLALYDANIEKGYMRKEINGMITRMRSIVNEYSMEVPWFQDEYKKVAEMMVMGDYANAMNLLNDIIIKASRDLPYLRYLRENLNMLNEDSSLLDEEGNRNILVIKRMILDYKFREAYDLINKTKDKINKKKLISQKNNISDFIDIVSATLLLNIFNGPRCDYIKASNSIKEILTDYQARYLLKEMEKIKEMNDILTTKLDTADINIKNSSEMGIFIFNLRQSLIMKILDQTRDKIDELFDESELLLLTPAYEKYKKMIESDKSFTKLSDFYKNLLNFGETLKNSITSWALEKGSADFIANEVGSINSIIRMIETKSLEENIQLPVLYNPQEIKKRIEFIEKIGKRISSEDIDFLIKKIEETGARLKNSLKITINTTRKESLGFALDIQLENDGSGPLFDVSINYHSKIVRIGDVYPDERRAIVINHENTSPEMLIISANTIDWKDYIFDMEIPAVVKYIRYIEKGKEGCSYCKGVILPGVEALKCNYCGKIYHLKCAQRSKKCIVCGNDFGL